MAITKYCIACNKQISEKDTIGINKKLLGEKIKNFYCMDCLADYLGCSIQDILDKIEQFKEDGCKLFS
jgi:biotin operon repressor